MNKYVRIDTETGKCIDIGEGNAVETYKLIGMVELDVEQSEVDGNWYITEKCPHYTEEELAQKEKERIALLNLTAADVERAIYKVKGLDFDDIITFVKQSGVQIDLKALKIELKANNFYRGNPYIEQVGTLLGFTTEQLDEFFKTNDYTKLLTADNSQAPPPSGASR